MKIFMERIQWLPFLFPEILCNPKSSASLSGGEWIFPESTKKLSSGTTSQLRCNNGYKKTGNPDTVVCQKNGTWSQTNATCVGK